IDHVDKAEILEIIDHHHIGDVETTKPIYYRNQKCGCTASIVYQLYKENDLEPDKSIAGMMLSAIISDTLYFQSETTTPSDIKIAHKLAQIAEVNLDEYARELLNSSVNLKDGDVNDLIERDLKRYEFGKYRIAVGQTNYSNLEDIQSRIKEFETVMKDKQERNDFDLIVMMFTHVLADGTMFLFYGPLSYLMFDVIQTRFDDNSGYDHNIMSRKQQLIPVLSDLILNL
ncbi:MAG: DHH family phosphoesterase, partial [Firmicutes bacterium]|nr:DHH family phosphoesterase [Bacillota bacterium]